LSFPGLSQPAAAESSPPVLNWSKQQPATHPPALVAASMAYDAAVGTVVLFGGEAGNHRRVLQGTWV
jgi:hypothetical protein